MVGDILQPTHLLFILVVALLVLGPKRLPEVGRQLGSGLRDFRAALSGERADHDERPPAQSYAPSPPAFAESHLQPATQEEPAVQDELAADVHPDAQVELAADEQPDAQVEPDYTTAPVFDDDPQKLGPERFESQVPEHDQPDGSADSTPAEFGSPPESAAEAAPAEFAPPPESTAEPAPAEFAPPPEPAAEPAPAEPELSAGGHELSLDPSKPTDPNA